MRNLIKRGGGLESLCPTYSLSESILLISNRLLAKMPCQRWQISGKNAGAEFVTYPEGEPGGTFFFDHPYYDACQTKMFL